MTSPDPQKTPFKQHTHHIVRVDWGNSANPGTAVPPLKDYAALVKKLDDLIRQAYPATAEYEEHYGRVTWILDETVTTPATARWHLRYRLRQEAQLHDHPGVLTWVENTEFTL